METKSNHQTTYAAWILAKRSEAEARGGKPIRHVSTLRSEGFYLNGQDDLPIPPTTQLAQGEILNPITGEISMNCLSIKKLADALGITSYRLADEMEGQGMVHRVLDFKEVPMAALSPSRASERGISS